MTTEKKLGNYINEKGLKIKYVAEKAGIPYQRLQAALKETRKLRTDEFLAACAVLEADPYLFMAD